MSRDPIGLSLAMLLLAASGCVCAQDGDSEEGDTGDGAAVRVFVDEESGNIRILVPKSANGQPGEEDAGKLVPHGKGLLNKSTGTYYEPAGTKGYRNRNTGEYEKAWDCYPRR